MSLQKNGTHTPFIYSSGADHEVGYVPFSGSVTSQERV